MRREGSVRVNSGNFYIFAVVALVTLIMVSVRLVRWARLAEDDGVRRRRFLLAGLFVAAEAVLFYFLAQVIAGNLSLG